MHPANPPASPVPSVEATPERFTQRTDPQGVRLVRTGMPERVVLADIAAAIRDHDLTLAELRAILDDSPPPATPNDGILTREEIAYFHSYMRSFSESPCVENVRSLIASHERLRSALLRSEAEPSEDTDNADSVALEVLCRVFDDGADEGMEEWRAWYQPHQWLNGSRALGAFIRQRLNARSAASAAEPSEDTLKAELAAREAEVRAWRWLHWGQAGAFWACLCGAALGPGFDACEDCGMPRPAKGIPTNYGLRAARSSSSETDPANSANSASRSPLEGP